MPRFDDLLTKLRATREDHSSEKTWNRFLLDAYSGAGGFAGRIKPPVVSSLGWVAEAYGLMSDDLNLDPDGFPSDSYLDQHPREDAVKYAKRRDVSHYNNYVEAILDLQVSYTLRHEPTLEDLPPQVDEWRQNVTPDGHSWRELMRQVIARHAALLGWCPLLLDRDEVPEGLSEAQVRDSGRRAAPYVTTLTPVNVLSWATDDDGVLKWAKIRVDYTRHDDPLTEPVKAQRFLIYDRDSIRRWVVINDAVVETTEARNPFGEVPLVSLKHKPAFGELLRGVSMVGDAAIASRRLFNLTSELDEHIRSTVFAMLQVPVRQGEDPPTQIISGSGNGITVPADSRQPLAYLAPPASVADTLEKRQENLVAELLRRARTRFGAGSRQAQSGVSKAWDFEETNRLLADFAAQLAGGELDVYRKVARFYGVDPAAIEKIRVIPPDDFAVQELLEELDNAKEALLLNLGPTADRLIKRRLVARMVPNMSTEDADKIEGELEEAANEEALVAAEDAEIQAARAQAADDGAGAGTDDGTDEGADGDGD